MPIRQIPRIIGLLSACAALFGIVVFSLLDFRRQAKQRILFINNNVSIAAESLKASCDENGVVIIEARTKKDQDVTISSPSYSLSLDKGSEDNYPTCDKGEVMRFKKPGKFVIFISREVSSPDPTLRHKVDSFILDIKIDLSLDFQDSRSI